MTRPAPKPAGSEVGAFTAHDLIRAVLFHYQGQPDDTVLSVGHWDTPEPDPEKMTVSTMPWFCATTSTTLGELRSMLDAR